MVTLCNEGLQTWPNTLCASKYHVHGRAEKHPFSKYLKVNKNFKNIHFINIL